MIQRGWARATINLRVDIIRRCFRQGVRWEMVPASTYEALRSLPGLRRGEQGVPEGRSVNPVPEQHIEAVRPRLNAPVAALVNLQLYTAARPGELVIMRPIDLDTSGRIWLYHPPQHKTSYRGEDRAILIGPRGQAELKPWLESQPATHGHLFQPAAAGPRARTAAAKDHYDVAAYRRAIARACDETWPPPERLQRQRVRAAGRKHRRWESDAEYRARLGEDAWAELCQWRRDHRWHPHQLRHNAATYLRKEFGLEAAQIILGHNSAAITELYAERDLERAKEIISRIG